MGRLRNCAGIGYLLLLSFLAGGSANAEVRLPKVLADHMVLQRRAPIHIWGWANTAEQVRVEFRGETRSATADDGGRWAVDLPAGEAGGPFTLTVQSSNTVTLNDVLVGDLWVASGQSNMEMPLNGFGPDTPVKDAVKEIAAATHPEIRFVTLAETSSEYPLDDATVAIPWQLCSPETAGRFSAVAYFFARDLEAAEKVPIGIVVSSWGGTPAESWTSLRTLTSDPALMPLLALWDDETRDYANELRVIEKERAEAKKSGKDAPWHANVQTGWQPAGLFNAMIAPLTPLRIQGVIWYQGESNASPERAALYARSFPAMITDWREAWRQGDFPFLYVQISRINPPAPSPWSVLREAQRRTLSVNATAMIVSADVGVAENVHPPDKQTIGARLVLAARALAYREPIEYSGPAYRQTSLEPGAVRIWFDHADELEARGGTLSGFEVAGADHKFFVASAKVEGSTVVASSASVANPIFVRYAWPASSPMTLFNREGLPASSFNSDDTYPNQYEPSK